MTDRQIDLKNPWLAGLLAFLIPGAGHFYQGRTFKGLIYSVCILGTFACGMLLGQGQVVYFRWDPLSRTWGYLAQFWVGLPALPALVQAQRTDPVADVMTSLDEPLSAPFQGALLGDGPTAGTLDGTIELEPSDFGTRGIVRGILTPPEGAPRPVELGLGGRLVIDREILAGPERRLAISVTEVLAGDVRRPNDARIEGWIPRSFWNWFEAPPGERQLQMLHRRLGKFFELAAVFTWIAGLLNILAIWDAIEGPAYGYGEETDESENTDAKTVSRQPPAGESAAAVAAVGAPAERPGAG